MLIIRVTLNKIIFFKEVRIMATIEQVIDDIVRTIDEGSKKFKYGLLWYLIYRLIGNGSDYHYQDLMKLTEKEIHDILKPYIEWSYYVEHGYDNITKLRKFITKYMYHKDSFHGIGPIYLDRSTKDEESHIIFDEVDFLSDVMYYLLTHNTWKNCQIMEYIHHAANRVIRNYQACKLIRYNEGLSCMEYIQSYYKRKGISFKCIW